MRKEKENQHFKQVQKINKSNNLSKFNNFHGNIAPLT
jgi:hypothetical protein